MSAPVSANLTLVGSSLVLLLLGGCQSQDARAGGQTGANGALRPHEIELANPYFKVWPAGMRSPWSWGTLPEGRPWGSTSAVQIDSDGRSVWVFDRCGSNHSNCLGSDFAPLVKFDADGNHLLSFGSGMFFYPHGLHVDREGNIWATDANGPSPQHLEAYPSASGLGHRVVKFSPDGQVLMSIGTGGEAGDPPTHLTAPTAVVTAPNGDVFITEGHSNEFGRVSHFTADGTFAKSWGAPGTEPGEFRLPHDIALDSQGRIFVADRSNYRVQIFDQDGKFIDEWKQFGKPSGIYISADDVLYVSDSHSWGDRPRADNEPYRKGIRIGSARTGEVQYYLPDLEALTRANSGAEGIAADAEGNIYAAIVRRLGVEKHQISRD